MKNKTQSKGFIVGYGRKSKEDRNAKGMSLENQEKLCREYALAQGYEFKYFEDNNLSGDNLKRKSYQDMVNFIKTNKVKCIVVYQLDRITRNIEDYYGIVQPMLRAYNTTIASINQHFDDVFTLEPMILAIYIGMATQELKNIKDRTKSVIKHRAQSGYALGKAPVGYLNKRDETKRGVIVPDPDKAHYIKRIYELYPTSVFSLRGLGLELAKYGFVDKYGRAYSKKRIEDILKNPIYMGKILYEGELYDGKHEAIVSPELFYRVQLMFKDTRKTRTHNVQFTYSNYLTCAKCGYAMVGILKHGAHKSGDYIYYHCSNYAKIHTKEKNIRQDLIDEAMQEIIDSFNIPDETLKRIKEQVFSAISNLQAYEYKSIEELNKQYSKLTDIISNSVKQKLCGELDIDDLTHKELMKKWQAEKDDIGNKISNLSANSKDTITRMTILADFANRLPELYLKATVEEKRLILATITDKIVFNEDTNTLSVKLKPVFEHLRQIKLQKKQEFSANVQTLTGTLEKRSNSAKQILKNIHPNVNEIKDYGTRQKLLNTKIEPIHEGSKKLNVDGGT